MPLKYHSPSSLYSVPNFDECAPRQPPQEIKSLLLDDQFDYIQRKGSPEPHLSLRLNTPDRQSGLAPRPLFIKRRVPNFDLPITQRPLSLASPRNIAPNYPMLHSTQGPTACRSLRVALNTLPPKTIAFPLKVQLAPLWPLYRWPIRCKSFILPYPTFRAHRGSHRSYQ